MAKLSNEIGIRRILRGAKRTDATESKETIWRFEYASVLSTISIIISAIGFYGAYFYVRHSMLVIIGQVGTTIGRVSDKVKFPVSVVILNKGNMPEFLQGAHLNVSTWSDNFFPDGGADIADGELIDPVIVKSGDFVRISPSINFDDSVVRVLRPCGKNILYGNLSLMFQGISSDGRNYGYNLQVARVLFDKRTNMVKISSVDPAPHDILNEKDWMPSIIHCGIK